MKRTSRSAAAPDPSDPPPHRGRLPGFITGDEVGLGDVVKRVAAHVGIRPCGGCERRAAALNRWLVFTRGRQRPGSG